MNSIRHLCLVAAALAVFLYASPPALGAEIQVSPTDSRIKTIEVEPTLKENIASLQVYCSVKEARLSIDRTDVGWIPYASDLEPGSHYLEVAVPGFYTLGAWFLFQEKTLYTIEFMPTKITGSLNIEVEPSDAGVFVDGAAGAAGLSVISAGPHKLVVRRFGYTERFLDVVVAEQKTTDVSVSLEKAPFALEKPSFSPEVFNPRNAGKRGKTALRFRATTYGSARAQIINSDGVAVATLEYPDMHDWAQVQDWDGLQSDGTPLPDGLYTAKLVARSFDAGAGENAEVSAEAQVQIDSTLVIRPFGTASGMPGLLYMPDSALESAGTIAAESFWFASLAGKLADSAFGLSASLSLGPAAFAVEASAEATAGPISSGDLAASALVALFGNKTSAWSGAFFLRGGYSSASAPVMPGAGSEVEVSLPFSARLGGLSGPNLCVALSPGARVDFSSSSPSYLGLTRAALWLEGWSFKTGFSGELPWSFASGSLQPAWPAKLALEGTLALGSTPFIAAAYATVAVQPSAAPDFGLGIALGLSF